MTSTAKMMREVMNFLILLLCINSATPSRQDSVALASRSRSRSRACKSSNFNLPTAFLSHLHSIRGGEIVHLGTFEETEQVIAKNADHDDQLVVILFSSTDCEPCKRVAPLFEELSEEFVHNVVFCKVDVDENYVAASQHQVTGWPAFLFFKKGEKIMEIVGGKLAEATLYDWVKLMAPKEKDP
mmetsp:Transcript_3047/g.8274  ORF Transcript_3047/g.8274 Transcript_3047/m.8274 type:complete len:184 (+) Transcript_3047:453-1004(+)|eukprot:CAMPEP_0197180300 /NCGR_PEP_ID=MMETSP1423-20130617/4952_1 /TAXON_ID=476441 /ORGANISM="Pseudo-nitzschia heimii, Strain UNC1101" /LENGTH=183 /DNA_ID=CAMNT_0042630353 /DNA_START=409 /DNA_END=960 /DNA_ORIENTATION=-